MNKKILTILLLISYLIPHTSVNAQSFDLSVSPAIFQIELTPPAVARAEKTILLENTGDTPLSLVVIYKPFSASNAENGEIVFEDRISGPDPEILKKVQLLNDGKSITTITLSPKQKKQLDLVVTVPKDEPPYDYYFTILFLHSSEAAPTLDSSNTVSQGAIGVNILLSIGPKTKTTGVIEQFTSPFFLPSGPVPFTVRVKNTSRHFIYPKGHIIIKNMFGQTIGKVDLLPVNILSNSTRAMPSGEQFIYAAQAQECRARHKGTNFSEVSQDAKCKEYNIKDNDKLLALSSRPKAFWTESFLLGPYTATLTIALSEEGPIYTRSVHFIGFPLQLLIGVVIILMVILLIRKRLKVRG